ncbi:MAG: glycine--tRNA ligase subunit beta [Methyloligellaceae bacterium]
MSNLLLELFSEEMPAGMQVRATLDLEKLLCDALSRVGLTHGTVETFVTPRRLTIAIADIPDKSPDISEERKGPRVGAPEKAIAGFLKSVGLSTVDECEIKEDKKGQFYAVALHQPGQSSRELLAEILPSLIESFPWSKSMRWGSGRLRWVRPLHHILCLLDQEIVTFEVDGVATGAETRGHRFLSPKSFKVTDLASYKSSLQEAQVILETEARKSMILDKAGKLAKSEGFSLIEDPRLLDEVAGLVEYPVVLMGQFDESFLDVPPEVLITSMKKHQKCFSLKRPKSDDLANRFITVANIPAEDGGRSIISGNERVIYARLSDASFFWDQDRKIKLDVHKERLGEIIFHEKLGLLSSRVQRLQDLTVAIAEQIGADVSEACRAAELCKADLVTQMVGEFPDLQGLMGKYYAEAQGESQAVAAAIESHYKPRGPQDDIPADSVASSLALADKVDSLVGFWAIDEKPSGSKDPYALRRATLGVIRLVLENNLRLPLQTVFAAALECYRTHAGEDKLAQELAAIDDEALIANLLGFVADRLKVYLRDQGSGYELIDAVFALGGQDDLQLIVHRVRALEDFLGTSDGENLLAGVKRAANILRIEEKQDKRTYDGGIDTAILQDKFESALHDAVNETVRSVSKSLEDDDFAAAMTSLANLRQPVDDFFENVIVNVDQPDLRVNRLKLLAGIRQATQKVADFSRISSAD